MGLGLSWELAVDVDFVHCIGLFQESILIDRPQLAIDFLHDRPPIFPIPPDTPKLPRKATPSLLLRDLHLKNFPRAITPHLDPLQVEFCHYFSRFPADPHIIPFQLVAPEHLLQQQPARFRKGYDRGSRVDDVICIAFLGSGVEEHV